MNTAKVKDWNEFFEFIRNNDSSEGVDVYVGENERPIYVKKLNIPEEYTKGENK